MQNLHALIISLFLLPRFLSVYVSISVHMAHTELRWVFQIDLLSLCPDANLYKQYNVENRIEIGLKRSLLQKMYLKIMKIIHQKFKCKHFFRLKPII